MIHTDSGLHPLFTYSLSSDFLDSPHTGLARRLWVKVHDDLIFFLRFINFYFVCMYVLLACVVCVLHMFMVSQIQKRVSGSLGIRVKDSYGLACGC